MMSEDFWKGLKMLNWLKRQLNTTVSTSSVTIDGIDVSTKRGKTTLQLNGVAIETNKTIASTEGNRVFFTDGSWCDVGSRKISNIGSGYIKLSSSPEGSDEEIITRGPDYFPATALDIGKLDADVEIAATDSDQISVTVTGPESLVEHILCEMENTTLRMIGTMPHAGGDSFTMTSSKGGSSVTMSNVTIGAKKNAVQVRIAVPTGTIIATDNISGVVHIGDTQGPIHATVDSVHNMHIGHVTDAILVTKSVGSIVAASVTGELSMRSSGTGSITVKGGDVSKLHIRTKSVGNASFKGQAQSGDLKSSGIGSIDVLHIDGDLTLSSQSVGKITVHNGSVTKLSAKTSGVGDIKFAGVAEDADLAAKSIGSITVKKVTNKPTVQKSGIGKIKVENW